MKARSEMITFRGRINRVFERRALLRCDQGPDFARNPVDVIEHWGPPSWWMQIGDIAFKCGTDRPPFAEGDEVEMTIRLQGNSE